MEEGRLLFENADLARKGVRGGLPISVRVKVRVRVRVRVRVTVRHARGPRRAGAAL